jgi:spermidine synthase
MMAFQRSISANSFRGILFCFLISGAAGLIYEVAWVKALTLIFGHSLYAVAAVLAVFMGGLAVGSAYVKHFARSGERCLMFYARIEFLIGLTGAVSLAGLEGVHWLYLALYPAMGVWKPLLFGLRFVCAGCVLFIPTFLMGGTFPVLASSVRNRAQRLSTWVSQWYWINTAGAVLGALFAGFILLPSVGLRLTIVTAAVLNLLAGLIARRIGARDQSGPRAEALPAKGNATKPDAPRLHPTTLLWLFGLVGFSALAFEVAWTRLLAVTIGSSTYGFTLILSTFLTGIALGSALFQRRSARSERAASLGRLYGTELTIGVTTLLSWIMYHWIPNLIPPLLSATNRTFAGLILSQFMTAACAVLPTSIALGFNFPLVVSLLDDAREGVRAGSNVGREGLCSQHGRGDRRFIDHRILAGTQAW